MNAPFQEPAAAVAKPPLTVLIAAPRGYCAGVDRAIEIVERALERYGAPVYVAAIPRRSALTARCPTGG